MTLGHSALLRTAVAVVPDAPFIELAVGSADTPMWRAITYAEFNAHVQRMAQYWYRELSALGLVQGDTVGFWVPGNSYVDMVQLMALFVCGYIPQCFALRNYPPLVKALLGETKAKAIIISPEYLPSAPSGADATAAAEKSFEFPVPILRGLVSSVGGDVLDIHELNSSTAQVVLPDNEGDMPKDGIAAFLHSSGTTSEKSKIIPLTYQWQDNVIHTMKVIAPARQRVSATWPGSLCHISSYLLLYSTLRYCATIVQQHRQPLSSAELVHMVAQTSINRALTFGTVLEEWIRDARADDKVLVALQRLVMIRYTGIEISEADMKWAISHGIRLSSIFTSTEVGLMLYSVPDGTPEGRYLRQALDREVQRGKGPRGAPNNPLIFRKADITMPSSDGKSTTDLYEIIVPPSSPHAPVPSLRDADGNFSTGDLVEIVAPGRYEFRGRGNNFFKHGNALWIAAGALEESFKTLSPSIISNAVIMGPGRPYLTLIIEPIDDGVVSLSAEEQRKLKMQIIADQAEENAKRISYAMITDPERIVFVRRGRLPRTAVKGSIQRRELERVFKDELEQLYGSPAASQAPAKLPVIPSNQTVDVTRRTAIQSY